MAQPNFTSTLDFYTQRQRQSLDQAPLTYTGATPNNGASNSNTGLTLYQFPFDAAPHNFVIVQGTIDFSGVTGTLTAQNYKDFNSVYVLPLPTQLVDAHEVQYDTHFNLLETVASIASAGASALTSAVTQGNPSGGLAKAIGFAGAAAPALAQAAGAVKGLALNNFRTLTLASPKFRTFGLEFRLYPKSPAESAAIARLIARLQTGALPGLAASRALLTFPDIFVCFFNTGAQYLYKFKPAVLSGIQADYLGGAPIPAFYANQDGLAIPEGVRLILSFIETEIWTRENIKTDFIGMPTPDPFSAVTGGFVNTPVPPTGNPIPPGRNPRNSNAKMPNLIPRPRSQRNSAGQ